MRYAIAIFYCALGCLSSFGQSAQAPSRDLQAIQIIDASIAALGGTGRISTLGDCSAAGQYETPTTTGWLHAGPFAWENSSTGEFRYENPSRTGSVIFVSGMGKPNSTDESGKTTHLFKHVAMSDIPPYLLGSYLFRELQNRRYAISAMPPKTINGKTAIHIAIEDPETKLIQQDWYLDPQNSLPLRVEYAVPEKSDANTLFHVAIEPSDFRLVSGVLVPFRIGMFVNDQFGGSAVLSSVTCGQTLDPSEFATSAGSRQ